ncbi:Membrane protease YdiL, CAAX protease family [Halovenus aranensis]|uniref:Membrane protease YdiL, CAAX protease family n=1 Tax=Halovenus aranensis TaxID=890420 RepID=A0A1G8VAW6_9EURY|nr:type II CAAX endopeptidase family protein [Halovenus aranensis]SDJ62310.1 Membrane protease YdiL, CAAX protease family [Halovenus aranensis]
MTVDLSALWRDLRIGWTIAYGEALDLWRRNDSRRQRAIYGFLALLVLPAMLLLVKQGYALGATTADGADVPIVATARNLLLPGLVAFAVLGGLGAVQSLARDPVQPLLLTSAPTRAIVVGNLLYLLGTWLVPMCLVAVPLVAYAVGAAAPLFPVAAIVFGIPLLFVTLLIGLTLAYLVWVGIERLGLPEYARRIVTASVTLIVFVLAFTGGFLSGQASATVDQLPTGDPATPLGWYADLLFVGSPVADPLGWQTLFAAALVFAAIPAIFAVQVRIAPAFWYATPKTADEDDTEPSGGRPVFEQTPSATIGRQDGLLSRSATLRAGLGYVRGAVRRPDQYVYLLYYLFPVLAVLLPIGLETPALLGPTLGGSLVVLGVWLAGGVVCLNPLGTEGAMLSQLVLARTPARTFVHARLLVGVCLGLAVGLAGAVLYLATGPFITLGRTLAVVPLLVGVVVTSAAFALGIGSALPKFETTEVFDSVETVAPSIIAALIHGGVTLLATCLAVALGALLTTPETPLSGWEGIAAFGLFCVVMLVVTDGSRRYAVARLRNYGRMRVEPGGLFHVYASLVLAVGAVVVGQAVGSSVALLVGLDRPVALLLPLLFVAEYAGYVLVVAGFLYVTRRGRAYLDVCRPSRRDLLLGLGGVTVSVGVWAVASLLISGLGLPVADHPLFSAEEGDPWLLLALVPLVLFVNAPVEELLYRNVVQKYLGERFSPTTAVMLASALFALAHVPAYLGNNILATGVTLSLLFAVSCVWGTVYLRTENVLVVAGVHGCYNVLLVAGAYLATV